MFLIDTNVLSETLRSKPDPRVQRWIDQHWASCGLSTPVLFELRLGAASVRDNVRRDQLQQTIDRTVQRFGPRLYALDRASADAAGDLLGSAARGGRVLERVDSQIAGIAAVYGLTLVTRNTRDFEVTGLDLLNPWQDN